MNIQKLPKLTIEHDPKGDICTNPHEIIKAIRNEFPDATNKILSDCINVSPATIQRWVNKKRSFAHKTTELRNYYLQKIELKYSEDPLLSKASPRQLFERCTEIGWDKVILYSK